MSGFARYVAGYILDSFRERVTAEDFAGEVVSRVLVLPGRDTDAAAVRRLFPQAELVPYEEAAGFFRVRRSRFDAAWIPMTGGGYRARAVGLLSGARHRLLVPSPDYIYRFGMRRGKVALAWAIVDRFLLWPLSLLWLVVVACRLYATGAVRQASQGEAPARPPRAVLVIRLVPARTLAALLRRLRAQWPRSRLYVLSASREGETEAAEIADEVIRADAQGPAALLRRVRRLRPDLAILAGGWDYGLSATYWRAVVLARACGAGRRYQWELGDAIPGRPLGQVARAILARGAGRAWSASLGRGPAAIARVRRRAAYTRPPSRGPRLVQIGVTSACNYHCLMCPFHNPQADHRHIEAQQPRLSLEVFGRLVGDLRRMGTEAIDICGNGEPLTHPDIMEMVSLARDLGLRVTLATNAALLSAARARRLVDLGLPRMHVSINAGTEETYAKMHPGTPPGTFAKIVGRLREMAEYAEETEQRPIDVEYSAVLTRLNMGEIEEMVRQAHRARAKWLMLIQMGPLTLLPTDDLNEALLPRPDDWPRIRRDLERAVSLAKSLEIETNLGFLLASADQSGTQSVYEKIPCYIGHEFALVLANGDVLFCCHCSYPLGNLYQDNFRTIWNSQAYQGARQQAMALPISRQALPACGCFDACSHVGQNLIVHRSLYGKVSLESAK